MLLRRGWGIFLFHYFPGQFLIKISLSLVQGMNGLWGLLVVCSRRMTIFNSFHSWKFPFLIPPLGDDWSFPSLKKTKAIQEIFLIFSSVYLRNMFLGIIFLWITQGRTFWSKVNSSTYDFQFINFHLNFPSHYYLTSNLFFF